MARGLEPNGTAVPVDVPSLLDVLLAEANLPFSPNPCSDTNCASAFSSVHTSTFSGYFVSSVKSCRDTNCASAFSSVYSNTFSGSFVSSVKPLSKTGTDPLGHQSGPWGSEPQFSRKEPILIY